MNREKRNRQNSDAHGFRLFYCRIFWRVRGGVFNFLLNFPNWAGTFRFWNHNKFANLIKFTIYPFYWLFRIIGGKKTGDFMEEFKKF